MKHLFIIRHAKSSWDNPSLSDFDRPLNEKGFKDAARMAMHLKSKELLFDYIITSPALRAITTAHIFAETLQWPRSIIHENASFYEFTDEGGKILSVIRTIDSNIQTIAVFGHNNTFLNLAQRLSQGRIEKFPTCSVASLWLDINDWSEIEVGKGRLDFFSTPKNVP